MTEKESTRGARRLGWICALAAVLVAGSASGEAANASAGCAAWTRIYTMHSSGTPSLMLPTDDGGLILVGDLGEVDFGEKFTIHDDWRVIAVKLDGCGKVQYATPVGPKQSAVEAAALDAAGSLYVSGASAHSATPSWIVQIDKDGRQVWSRQYPAKHSGFIALHPSGDGGIMTLTEVARSLTVGDRTFVDPESEDRAIFQQGIPMLIAFDGDGRLTYSEAFDRHARFLFQGRDRFYVATRLGTGHAGSNYPNEVEARTNEGRMLWRRELEPIGQLAVLPRGGLLHFVDSYARRCGWAWYQCPMEKRERIEIDDGGQIVSRFVVEGFGKTPVSPSIAKRLRSGRGRGKAGALSGGIVWDVDRDGYAILRGFRTGYLVVDDHGRIVDADTLPGLQPSRDGWVRPGVRWAADGAAFALYFKSEDHMTFHLVKWTPRR